MVAAASTTRIKVHSTSAPVIERRRADTASTRALPDTIGSYQVIERLAIGGMAEVFKARKLGDHGFEKLFALKKILPHLGADRASVEMFLDEARITASLEHPHIVQAFELGHDADSLYFAMEFVDGIDVLELLQNCARTQIRLPATLAALIVRDVLDALDYTHEARDANGRSLAIVHRDVSPSNVLLSWKGHVKLTDFGVALAARRRHQTAQHTLRGKYGYMSPEQVSGGHIDGRSDLFSVGILLAEMVMARRLFTGPTDLDVLLAVRDVKLERLDHHASEFPIELLGIVLRALQLAPRDRWQTAGEMRDALDEWLSRCDRVSSLELSAFIAKVTTAPTATFDHNASTVFVRGVNPVIPPAAVTMAPIARVTNVTVGSAPRPARGTPAPKPAKKPAKPLETDEIELCEADALEVIDDDDDVFDAVTADGLHIEKLAREMAGTPVRGTRPQQLGGDRRPARMRAARSAMQPIVAATPRASKAIAAVIEEAAVHRAPTAKTPDVRPTAQMDPEEMRAYARAACADRPSTQAIETSDILLDSLDLEDSVVELDGRPTEQDMAAVLLDDVEVLDDVAIIEDKPVVDAASSARFAPRNKVITGLVSTVPRRKKEHTVETAIASLVEESQILELPRTRAARGTGRFATPHPVAAVDSDKRVALPPPRRARRDAVSMPALQGKPTIAPASALPALTNRPTAPMAVQDGRPADGGTIAPRRKRSITPFIAAAPSLPAAAEAPRTNRPTAPASIVVATPGPMRSSRDTAPRATVKAPRSVMSKTGLNLPLAAMSTSRVTAPLASIPVNDERLSYADEHAELDFDMDEPKLVRTRSARGTPPVEPMVRQRRPSTGVPVRELLPLPPRRESTGNPAYEPNPRQRNASTSLSVVAHTPVPIKSGKLARLSSVGKLGEFGNYSDGIDDVIESLGAQPERTPAPVRAKKTSSMMAALRSHAMAPPASNPSPSSSLSTLMATSSASPSKAMAMPAILAEDVPDLSASRRLLSQLCSPLGILAMLVIVMVGVFLLAMYGVL